MWCDLLSVGFWIDDITFNAQLRVSAGSIADMLIPYETVHNHFSSGRVLVAAFSVDQVFAGFGVRILDNLPHR